MQKILKITSLILVVLLSLSLLSACVSAPTTEPETTEETTKITTQAETEKEQETLVVGLGPDIDYFPFKYKDGEKLNGINIEIMNAVAKKLNMKVDFVQTVTLSSQHEDVKVDAYINQYNSDNFEVENAVFSKSYLTDTQSVIVKATADYAVYDDFYSEFDVDGYPTGVKDGIKIGVKKTTTADIFASASFKEWGFEQTNVKEFTTNNEMVNALKNDEITAIIIDDAIAREIVDSVSGLKILESSFYSAEYSVAVVSEDEEKQNKIITAINELIDDGTVKAIVDKYMQY